MSFSTTLIVVASLRALTSSEPGTRAEPFHLTISPGVMVEMSTSDDALIEGLKLSVTVPPSCLLKLNVVFEDVYATDASAVFVTEDPMESRSVSYLTDLDSAFAFWAESTITNRSVFANDPVNASSSVILLAIVLRIEKKFGFIAYLVLFT